MRRLCRFIGNRSAVRRSASVFQACRLGRLAVRGTHLKVMKKWPFAFQCEVWREVHTVEGT
jgi:hypothetical protein